MNSSAAIAIDDLSKRFSARLALDGVRLRVAPGEMVALIGASGSGKSTLLRHVAGFTAADRGGGLVEVFGERIQADGRIAADIRRQRQLIGFIFQQFNLVGRLSVLTNVLTGVLPGVPSWRALTGRFSRRERLQAIEALASVGIAELAFQRASTLSGGQQQRVALARALVQGARVLLADEPVASLDPESSRRVMELLREMNTRHGLTVLVSLHQVELAIRYCPRTIALRDGRIVFDGPSAALSESQLRALYGSSADELFEGFDRDRAGMARSTSTSGAPCETDLPETSLGADRAPGSDLARAGASARDQLRHHRDRLGIRPA